MITVAEKKSEAKRWSLCHDKRINLQERYNKHNLYLSIIDFKTCIRQNLNELHGGNDASL